MLKSWNWLRNYWGSIRRGIDKDELKSTLPLPLSLPNILRGNKNVKTRKGC